MNSQALIENDWRDRYEWPTEDTWLVDVARWVVNAFLRTACKVDLVGLDRVSPTGPLIVAANHLHSFDAFLVAAFFPRKLMFLARASAYRFPPVGWFLRMCGAFPITRGQADQWSLNWSLEILKQGKVVGIFPEGRCQRSNGMAVAKTGVALIAYRAGAPILPVAITGTELLRHWPKGGKFAMGLRVGSVLEVEKIPEPNPEQLRLITDEVMYRIARLLPPSYQGVYRL